jgi:hypothetical protein
MAQKKTRTAAAQKNTRKKRPTRKKTASPGLFAGLGSARLLTYLIVLVCLLVSLAVVSYVIFFRVVVAHHTPDGGETAGWTCSRRDPGLPPAAPRISSNFRPASSAARPG